MIGNIYTGTVELVLLAVEAGGSGAFPCRSAPVTR